MTASSTPSVVFVEHVLWEPDAAWTDALEHVAGRFARATPLDLDAVRAAGALHEQLSYLAGWAADAGVDLDRELGRYLDEHLSMHVRPAPTITRAVRALAVAGPVHAVSALPPRAAESIARHAGCWRSIAELHANVRDAATLGAVLEQLDGARVVAADPTPLPEGTASSLL
ncbi:MAG: hypothetical protein JWL76_582 [Thermoleophilia bacterium]|nr:hypothetical protein [Thermoleophilia bacterium]